MKIRITTLSPIHISSGREFDENFNFFVENGKVYILDEFKLVEFFISQKILIPDNLNMLKNLINNKKQLLISNKVYEREFDTEMLKFGNKPLIEHITTQNTPIIPGSSIKGAIETAVLDLLVKNDERVQDIKERLNINISKKIFEGKRGHTTNQNFIKLFKTLKVSDTSLQDVKTKVYKTINMKKDKSHQETRTQKVERIANFVEAITPNQTFEIELKDENGYFHNLVKICKGFYAPHFNQELKFYFKKPYPKEIQLHISKLKKSAVNSDKTFILNVGRFGGALKKTISRYRYIKNSHSDDKKDTTAITFALEKNGKPPFFENDLQPFGWLLCEIIS